MDEKPVMLIVDNIEINRTVLGKVFGDDYGILEAESGQDALAVLSSKTVNVVLLALDMPEMDGFAFLSLMRRTGKFSEIPVVATMERIDHESEAKAMELGAADFITKPYHPTVVRCRVRNVLGRHENEWRKLIQVAQDQEIVEMQRYMETDTLTGLYNRDSFYRKAAEVMKGNTGTLYDIVYLDISCFKIINSLFHMETGNVILKAAGFYFSAAVGEKGVAARLEADHFAMCIPDSRLKIEGFMQGLDDNMKTLGINHNIRFFAGIYPVHDPFLPVDRMCDWAHMALNKIKGSFVKRYAYYDDSMWEVMLREQTLVRDMEIGLHERQFRIYMQAVYNLEQRKIVGAEALVRWIHPVIGTILPAYFIPLFERNGFITRMDRYVWERVCQFLKDQKDKLGTVVPVSVNVSRLNFYNLDLLQFLLSLVEKYGLEPWMLKLEITETAYMDEPEKIISVIKEFRAQGFVILMDDFGSGHSSLSMLKNLPVDVLKLDMSFAHEVSHSRRVNAILKFIMSLSRELDMQVIVEGVETKKQLDIVSELGCQDIQGYYFSRPLPADEFMKVLEEQASRKEAAEGKEETEKKEEKETGKKEPKTPRKRTKKTL